MLQSIPIPAADRGQSKKPASPARQRRLSRPTVKKPQASCSVVAQAFSQIATSARNRSRRLDAAEADAVAGVKAAAEKEAGLHKAIAALTRIEDAERQLRAARAARRAKAKEKAADSLCATRS